nr:MAG TPA: hypothetical protein [Caudoviricetes sp.]
MRMYISDSRSFSKPFAKTLYRTVTCMLFTISVSCTWKDIRVIY